MSSRAHRFEASRSPLADHHGGTAAAARAAIKASRLERHQQFLKAKEIVRRQLAERPPAPVEKPAGGLRRLRPRARAAIASRWKCRPEGRLLARDRAGVPCWVPKDVEEARNRRRVLVAAQGGLCALCGKPVCEDTDRASATMRASVDHTVPRMLGGVNRFNLVAAHQQCNADKDNDLPTGCEIIWLLVVNARVRQLPAEMIDALYR